MWRHGLGTLVHDSSHSLILSLILSRQCKRSGLWVRRRWFNLFLDRFCSCSSRQRIHDGVGSSFSLFRIEQYDEVELWWVARRDESIHHDPSEIKKVEWVELGFLVAMNRECELLEKFKWSSSKFDVDMMISSINSSKMIGNFPAVLTFNRLFLKLNRFTCS